MAITKQEILSALNYDRDTGNFTYKISVNGVKKGDIAGHLRADGLIRIMINKKLYSSNKLVWIVEHNEEPERYVFRINPSLPSKISNLRLRPIGKPYISQKRSNGILHFPKPTAAPPVKPPTRLYMGFNRKVRILKEFGKEIMIESTFNDNPKNKNIWSLPIWVDKKAFHKVYR
ncbi:MAG: hypothetical protein COA78_22060 [Blastopirellula sp.]|nr:MAG: hypothetical protein COA78_22060 [Blastopirellula sp.]